jgi:hypothetical protein
MSQQIVRIEVVIEPLLYSDRTRDKLKIIVKTWPGGEFHLEEALPQNDFESLFDAIWNRAGRALKNKIGVSHEPTG